MLPLTVIRDGKLPLAHIQVSPAFTQPFHILFQSLKSICCYHRVFLGSPGNTWFIPWDKPDGRNEMIFKVLSHLSHSLSL